MSLPSHGSSETRVDPLWILEQAVGKIITEPLTLLLVEQRAINQVMAGFNPKLDAQ